MKKQEVKIEYNQEKVYFFQHSLKTAMDHANAFIERNKGKFEMKLFILNKSNFGEKWIPFLGISNKKKKEVEK